MFKLVYFISIGYKKKMFINYTGGIMQPNPNVFRYNDKMVL